MTDAETRSRAARTPAPRPLAGAAVAMLVALTGRAGLAAIPLGLALWAVIGLAVTLAGASLGHHAHLIGWGIALMAATVAGAAAGLPLAARR